MNVPQNILNYYALLESVDDAKHPINCIKPDIVFTDKEIGLYFITFENELLIKNIYGGKEEKILIF